VLKELSPPGAGERRSEPTAAPAAADLVPVFVINLDKDRERRDLVLGQFSALPGFAPQIVEGVYGRALSDNACEILTQEKNWARHKGTIGCFISHVKAWEEVARIGGRFAVVVEDDVDARGLKRLARLLLPADAEIVFLNDRMSPEEGDPEAPVALPIIHALRKLDAERGGPGGDGYLLTPVGARKLLAACLKDFYYGHVDGRLLQYASGEKDLAMLAGDAWIARVIRYHRHPVLIPKLGLLKAYCLSRPMVRHLGIASIREAENRRVAASAAPPAQPKAPGAARADVRNGLPIRFWNYVRNAGDQINPYIFETVAGRTTYLSAGSAEHVLGVGSIFFMATAQSHIWGSGILDPNADYGQVSPARVHAVRGKLTYGVLRERYGLSKPVPLGDPGVFADEIPEIRAYLTRAERKRRVALIPHHGLIGHKYIQEIAGHADTAVINPRLGCLDFIREIIASEIVISQSLHGIIFAQVFGRPFVWLSHSADETWLFKFRDWFSTTLDAPAAPAMFGTPFDRLIERAEARELAIDKGALRAALPELRGDRRPGIGFRESQLREPVSFRIAARRSMPASPSFDETIICAAGDETALQNALHAVARGYDHSFNLFLAFDEKLFGTLTRAEIEAYRTILDEHPEIHYLLIVPAAARKAEDGGEAAMLAGVATVERKHAGYDWQGVALVRNPFGFSFAARGRIVFRP